MNDPGTQALSEYIFYSKYSNFLPEKGRQETWDEAVDRVIDMHRNYYGWVTGLRLYLDEADEALRLKKCLGSQRNMQYGGRAVLLKHARSYNCGGSFCDRRRFFAEVFWLLLCGCGTGFSVQKHHVAKLPPIKTPVGVVTVFTVPDTIEGWADALHALIQSYFDGSSPVIFDYTLVRPKGSLLSTGAGKAPGPEPLRESLEKIRILLHAARGRQLKPIECYDIVMHAACAVLSGGVRRSATICIFSPDDEEMMTAKSGKWFETNPQRKCSNNSALLIRNETSQEQFNVFVDCARYSGGEPGFFWSDSTELVPNPCLEISFYPVYEGVSGWQFCNLSTINGMASENENDFYRQCRAASILGTLQAGYTRFSYLEEVSELITKREALLGVSITGVQDNPGLLLNHTVLQKGVQVIKETNKELAPQLCISPAARLTALKPEGTSSSLLGSASGKHRRHGFQYIRSVQANKLEKAAQLFQERNPGLVEDSVWREGDIVLRFPIQSPEQALVSRDEPALNQLQDVVTLQTHWVMAGKVQERCSHPALCNNVSNTVTVRDNEWGEVSRFIFDNRQYLTGVSLLSASGDLDYPQAPFVSVDEPERVSLKQEWQRLRAELKTVDYSKADERIAFSLSPACVGGACEL